jgi:hypothetical protein
MTRAESDGSALLDQVVLEDRHLELERAIIVLIVDKQDADERESWDCRTHA